MGMAYGFTLGIGVTDDSRLEIDLTQYRFSPSSHIAPNLNSPWRLQDTINTVQVSYNIKF